MKKSFMWMKVVLCTVAVIPMIMVENAQTTPVVSAEVTGVKTPQHTTAEAKMPDVAAESVAKAKPKQAILIVSHEIKGSVIVKVTPGDSVDATKKIRYKRNGEDDFDEYSADDGVEMAENGIITFHYFDKEGREHTEDYEVANINVENNEKSPFAATFWALVPPIVTILIALITKEVYFSLFVGIALGGCLAANFNPLKSMVVINEVLIETVSNSTGIFIFLIILGVMVALISCTGATAAFGNWAKEHVKSRMGAQLATFVLGVLIFIDDYFNCLVVGNVMRPVMDAKRISRAKLAFIIDATAAPICMIAPGSLSSAAVTQYDEGTGFSGLAMFVRTIPYNFYCLLTLVFVLCIILMKVDFGPMAKHERNAMEKGDLFTSGGEVGEDMACVENPKGKIIDILIPMVILIGFCMFALLYVGGILDGKGFFQAFGNANASVGMPLGCSIALILTIIYLLVRKVITLKEAMECVPAGFKAMVPAILILAFAIVLKNMTTLLDAKVFIAQNMTNAAPHLANFLPAVIFIVACILAFATGTSWGTYGILIPIVTALFEPSSPLLFIGISACLAGAVCGDHGSPVSDTTIVSSAGARCKLVNHVMTQLPYVIVIAAVSSIGYILAGLIQNWFIVFPITVVMLVGILTFIKIFGNGSVPKRVD